jgi:hypothetical protein
MTLCQNSGKPTANVSIFSENLKIPGVVRELLCLIFSRAHLDEPWQIFQKRLTGRFEQFRPRRRTDRERCQFIAIFSEISDMKPNLAKSDASPTKYLKGEILSETNLKN